MSIDKRNHSSLSDLTNYKHKFEIQIRFADTDLMGHVNHANYLSYVEAARLNYYDTVVGQDTDWHSQHGLIMARFEIDYRLPLAFDDFATVYTRCIRMGTRSFELSWVITTVRGQAEQVAAAGKAVIVCYDYVAKQPIEIPANKRAALERFEQMS